MKASHDISPYDYDFDPDGDSTAARLVRLVGENKKVLELGCGYGVISRKLVERNGCEVVGVERDEPSARSAERWLSKLVVADLEADNWAAQVGQGFDVVLASDVIEHLREPSAVLRQAKLLMTPAADLVLSTPNIGHVGVIAQLLTGMFEYRPTGILDNTHLRFFTWSTLEAEINSLGFEVTMRETVNAPGSHEHFLPYWHALPASLRSILATHPTGEAFQFVLRAKQSDAPTALPTDDNARLHQWLHEVERWTLA
jgi:SAM-dependent methyltransferase